MDYMSSFVDQITIKRNNEIDGVILGQINSIAVENGIATTITLNEKAIVSALRKHTPKKVTHEATLYKCCTCPNCKNVVDEYTSLNGKIARVTYKYCHFCGQALDWSDIEGGEE